MKLRTCYSIVLLLIILPGSMAAQQLINADNDNIDTTHKKDIIDVVHKAFKTGPQKIARRRGKKVYFSFLPTSAPVPGGGKALITSTRAGFYLGNRKNTFLSNVSFSPYLNFNGRFSVSFRSDIYTSKNKWNIQGDTRFSLYPEYVYGSRNGLYKDDRLIVTYKYIRFYQTVLKRVKPYFLAGIGFNLDYHIGIRTIDDTIGFAKFIDYAYGTKTNSNTLSSGIALNFLYDTRNNSINPLPGAYFNLIYRGNAGFLSNSRSNWKSLYLDARKYFALPGPKRHMIAVWNYIWTALNNDVPYLDLPAIGNEPNQRSGRGMEQNRYRGKSLVYLETEYRSDLTDNGLFGFVVFANVNTVTGPGNGSFGALHPAAGAGLRIKFDKRSNTNIAADFGFSKGASVLTLSLGEAF